MAEAERGGGLASVVEAERAPKPVLRPSPGLGAWLASIGGSLAFSTYQSSRLFLISPDEKGGIVAQERIVGSAMGLAVAPDALWIANKEQVWRFSNVGALRIKDRDHDAVFMPRKGYLIGGCDTHDIAANTVFKGVRHELMFINTVYSCVAAIDPHWGFRPLWKPDFITALSPEDRCHLNGLCVENGELTHVTLCGRYDTPIGWKAVKNGGGVVVDVRDDRVVCDGLSMPHSPRAHQGRLWLLNSGDGDFGHVDAGRFVPIAACPGFARGLAMIGDYAVIGLSKPRDNLFSSGMALTRRLEEKNLLARCGLIVVDLRTGATVHWLGIDGVVSELYDVAFLPNIIQPYTPGFSEPELHRELTHAAPGVFPFAVPRPWPEAAKTDDEPSSRDDAEGRNR